MLTPRDEIANPVRKDLKFIGGTENFDLWFRAGAPDDMQPFNTEKYPLRIHRVAGGRLNWDVFQLPLLSNDPSPLNDRGVTGYWNDVILFTDDIEQIETYLRCFAPWLMKDTVREPPNE